MLAEKESPGQRASWVGHDWRGLALGEWWGLMLGVGKGKYWKVFQRVCSGLGGWSQVDSLLSLGNINNTGPDVESL